MPPIKIAVTGASGFIGRHVLAALAQSRVEITAVTRDPTRLVGLSALTRTVVMDISQPGADCFDRLGRPDILIHLSWEGLPNYTSLHHFETELPRQFNFLKLMIQGGLSSLFVAGTCFEYGLQFGPLSEDSIASPSNPYGYAKDALRRQLEFLQTTAHFSLTWGRLFYIHGQAQSRNAIFPQLHNAIMRGETVFNMSGGEQLRDYLSAEEVGGLIANLALRRCNFGCINICSGKPIAVRTLVENWIKENNWNIKLNLGYYPYPSHEPMAFWGQRHKLARCLELA